MANGRGRGRGRGRSSWRGRGRGGSQRGRNGNSGTNNIINVGTPQSSNSGLRSNRSRSRNRSRSKPRENMVPNVSGVAGIHRSNGRLNKSFKLVNELQNVKYKMTMNVKDLQLSTIKDLHPDLKKIRIEVESNYSDVYMKVGFVLVKNRDSIFDANGAWIKSVDEIFDVEGAIIFNNRRARNSAVIVLNDEVKEALDSSDWDYSTPGQRKATLPVLICVFDTVRVPSDISAQAKVGEITVWYDYLIDKEV